MAERRSEQAMYEAQRLFQDRTDKLIQANTESINGLSKAITQQGQQIDGLRASIEAQSVNIGRLERAVSDMVLGINAQRETMQQMMQQQGEFLKLATRQTDIIGTLTAGKAS